MTSTPPFPYDLAVCYRIYPGVSGSPIFGFKDKLPLLHLNLQTFKAGLGALKIKLWVLLDKCPASYEDLLKETFAGTDMEIIPLGGEGNRATFHRQADVLSTQTDSDLVYFAEDDYLYLPRSLERMVQFMRAHPETDFATVYDHPDNHKKFIHRFQTRELVNDGHRWRMIVSTCLTFMARKEALMNSVAVFKTFNKNPDLAIWMALTKLRVRNPWSWVRSAGDGLFFSASHALAWRYAWRQIIFGKRRTLWAPIPTLGTHMDINGLAPGANWQGMFAALAAQVRERLNN
ncbi:MAG TPA: glycosyltransferase family 2 protein [Verrucomicrobiae bacterium]|nr:glycosyltransferase family 2 protein [Verrucomicrobiae bacterium]